MITVGSSTVLAVGGNGLSSIEILEAIDDGGLEWRIVDEWTMPENRSSFCAVSKSDHEIIIIGGVIDDGGNGTNRVDLLDLSTGEFTALPAMHSNRSKFGCMPFRMDGRNGIIVGGGW